MGSDRNYLLLTAVPQMDQQLSTQILHPLNFVNDDKARFFYLRQVLVSTMSKIKGFLKVLCKSLQVTGAENAALTLSLAISWGNFFFVEPSLQICCSFSALSVARP